MFAKNSRYYKLESSAELDARGQVFEAKILRLLPDTPGQFQHIVEGSDRLDTLAYKYYQDPLQWWRLCDANPEFYFPTDLIGKSPQRTKRFSLQWDQNHIPWSSLAETLTRQPGVEKVQIGTQDQTYPDEFYFDAGLLFSMNASLVSEIDASIRAQELTAALALPFQTSNNEVGSDIRLETISSTEWRLQDLYSKNLYTLRLEQGAINVYRSTIRAIWSVTVFFNQQNVTSETLAGIIEAFAPAVLNVLSIDPIQRIGKSIIVPPMTTVK